MKRPTVRVLGVLAVFAALPLMSAESCDPQPANIRVVSVTITAAAGRLATDKTARLAPLLAPGTTSDGGRYSVPSNTPGTLAVTFTSDRVFSVCTLDLDGRTELSVTPDGSGKYVVRRSTSALSSGRTVSGSLTCTPTTGFSEAAVSTFSVTAHAMARLVAEPAVLDFGSTLVTSRPRPEVVRVTNVGEAPTVFMYLAGGGDGFDATASIRNRTVLRARQSFTITVRFVPTKVGTFRATYGAITDSLPPTILVTANGIAGAGVPPSFQASTNHVAFDAINTGSSQERSFTIMNAGVQVMQVTALTMAGNDPSSFAVTSESCTTTRLTAGVPCTVTVRFRPTRGGYTNAVLRVSDNTSSSPHEITFTGDGIAPVAPQPDPTYVPPYPP